MAGRLYPLNRFIAPDFSLLVPDWTFGMAVDDYCAASYSYAGPVYVLLTPADIAVLINISPERERDAVDLICRVPHHQRINHSPSGPIRDASAAETMSALSRLADVAGGNAATEPQGGIRVVHDTGVCLHDEPHRVSVFRLEGERCTDLVTTGDRDRIASLGEE